MHIDLNYSLYDNGKLYSCRTIKVTEDEIIEMLHEKFKDRQLPIPMHINKDTATATFYVESVTS